MTSTHSPATPGEDCGSEFTTTGFGAHHPMAPHEPSGGRAAKGHAHNHAHTQAPERSPDTHHPTTATTRHRKKLILVISITLAVFVVQVIGALVSNSLSLLADAGHMLTDATGVAIALIASMLAGLPATSKRTFGFLRVEILAALTNGIVLGVIAVVIFVQAVARFGQPVEIASTPMLVAAVIGAVANLTSLLILRSGQNESLNLRGAYLEVMGDLLGSIAVIIAALVIMLTGWTPIDQIASLAIAVLIVPRAISLLRDVVNVLLEATPKGLDLDVARAHMLTVPGVVEVHDVHAWTITSGVPAFSAHVTVSDEAWHERGYHAILDELRACLQLHFATEHVTLQLEPVSHVGEPHAHP